MPSFVFKNFWNTVLTAEASSTDEVFSVPAAMVDLLPSFAGFKVFCLALWDGVQSPEVVYCTAAQGTNGLLVTRGQEDTSAKAWPAGTQVVASVSQGILDKLSAVSGIAGDSFVLRAGDTMIGDLMLKDGFRAASLNDVAILSGGGGYLLKVGGVMEGQIDMAQHTIANLPVPTGDNQAVNKKYVDDSFTGLVNAQPATFANGVRAQRFVIADAQHYIQSDSGDAHWNVDDGDNLTYNRSGNYWTWTIAGNIVMRMSPAGISLGDDANLGDNNVTNGLRLAGLANPSQGFLQFGTGPRFGWDGNQHVSEGSRLRVGGSGGGALYSDGNVNGTQWGGNLSDYLNNRYVPRDANQNLGAYAMMKASQGWNYGDVVSYTQLAFSSAAGNIQGGLAGGSWRCCGHTGTGSESDKVTLFQRIA